MGPQTEGLVGVGFALTFPTLNMQGTAGVSDNEQGVASGLVQTSFQIGGAIGLAAVSAVVADGDVAAYRTGIAIVLGVAVLGLLIAVTGVVRPRTQEVLATTGA